MIRQPQHLLSKTSEDPEFLIKIWSKVKRSLMPECLFRKEISDRIDSESSSHLKILHSLHSYKHFFFFFFSFFEINLH